MRGRVGGSGVEGLTHVFGEECCAAGVKVQTIFLEEVGLKMENLEIVNKAIVIGYAMIF